MVENQALTTIPYTVMEDGPGEVEGSAKSQAFVPFTPFYYKHNLLTERKAQCKPKYITVLFLSSMSY